MGKTVGEYKLLKTIGEGSFSKVKHAIHVPTQKHYAIKIIDRNLVIQNQMENQLKREINIMSKMDHPGFIKLYSVMHSAKNIFLVLDLAEGGELFNKLAQDGPLSEDVARSYFQQLIDALDYMHSKNAAHRDLKPENLLLDKEGRLKIADFGLSIMAQSPSEMLKTRCGTPNYVAPEIFSADSYSGPPADIWSAGVILFVMLSATLPFDAPTLPELARQIMNVKISYPRSFSRGVSSLIRKILVADPRNRITVAEIRQDPWFSVNYKQVAYGTETNDIVDEEVSITEEQPNEEDAINAFELIAKINSVNIDRLVDNSVPINASTTFTSTKPIQEIKKIIQHTIDGLRGQILTSSSNNSFKVSVPVSNNIVTSRIDIIPVTGQTYLIEFCRLKGSQFDFLRFFRTIKQRLI